MVGDGLGWMRVCGLWTRKGWERLHMGGSGFKMSRSGLNRNGSG